MNRDALFSDGTKYYQNPPEPKSGDTVTIRLRTAKGEDCVVVLCTGDERIPFSREVESTDPLIISRGICSLKRIMCPTTSRSVPWKRRSIMIVSVLRMR